MKLSRFPFIEFFALVMVILAITVTTTFAQTDTDEPTTEPTMATEMPTVSPTEVPVVVPVPPSTNNDAVFEIVGGLLILLVGLGGGSLFTGVRMWIKRINNDVALLTSMEKSANQIPDHLQKTIETAASLVESVAHLIREITDGVPVREKDGFTTNSTNNLHVD